MSRTRFHRLNLAIAGMAIAITALGGCDGDQMAAKLEAGDTYFPLSVGNRWVLQTTVRKAGVSTPQTLIDTVSIVARTRVRDNIYYQASATWSWPGFSASGRWVRRDTAGNLWVSAQPGGPEARYLIFDADVGDRWNLPEDFDGCLRSLTMIEDYAVVSTPIGRFDGATAIGGGWVDCSDFGWTASFARGVGPVKIEGVTIAGTWELQLIAAVVHEDQPEVLAGRLVDGRQ